MITVKGTKSEAQPNDPADIYALKSGPQNSRTPYVIGALISALVLYLKSAIFPQAARAHEKIDEGAAPSAKTGTSLTEDILVPPPLEQTDSIEPELDTTPSGSFRFSATAIQTNFHGSRDVTKTLTSGFSGSIETPANWDRPPNALTSEMDLQSLFGSTDAIADAWPPEEPKEESAIIDETHVRNRAPRSVRPNYLFDVTSGAVVMIALSDLLANISDPDGDELTILDASVTSGTLTKVDGGYLFRADPAMLGPVQMKFTVSDGQASITEVAHFSIVPNENSGTDQADVLAGTLFIDEIHGLENDDNIDARAGNDIIYGGSGDDTLSGGQGDDAIFGGAGNDNIRGGAGNDLVSGGDGNDHIFGDDGDDILFGDEGNDVLSDGIGADIVFGGAGDDLVAATADAEDDFFDGGEGEDTLDYSQVTSDMKINLVAQVATGNDLGSDIIMNFEIVKGGGGNDHFIIGAEEVTLFGGGGANTFEFINVVPVSNSAISAHQILDFNLGDTIKTSKLLIFEKPDDDDDDDLFDVMSGSANQADDSSYIRYRYEKYDDDREETIVEWDNDDFSQLTIVALSGHHVLTWTENS